MVDEYNAGVKVYFCTHVYNSPKLAEFQKIILAGDYGTVSAAAERVGVSRMTGHLWARKILAQSATKGGK